MHKEIPGSRSILETHSETVEGSHAHYTVEYLIIRAGAARASAP